VGVQVASRDIEGCSVDASVMAVSHTRCASAAFSFASCVCNSCRAVAIQSTEPVPLRRSVLCQTSSGEGSASVACGCDVTLACFGVQTEEEWTDGAAAAAAAAAAAETIEGLQQELVG
jgi:hypothetical protein